MEQITEQIAQIEIKTKNKGTRAGGKNTTLNGGAFENITSIESTLLSMGFVKKTFHTKSDYFMERNIPEENKLLIYVKQWGLRMYMEQFYQSSAIRKPDEAFLIIEKSNCENQNQDKITINILEKKYQSVDGSVDIKLWAGCALKREYELYYDNKHKINYSFALSKYLIDKINSKDIKWVILKKILSEHDIYVFNPDHDDYYTHIINWAFPYLKSHKEPRKSTKKTKVKNYKITQTNQIEI
jgi:hypothetical protein